MLPPKYAAVHENRNGETSFSLVDSLEQAFNIANNDSSVIHVLFVKDKNTFKLHRGCNFGIGLDRRPTWRNVLDSSPIRGDLLEIEWIRFCQRQSFWH